MLGPFWKLYASRAAVPSAVARGGTAVAQIIRAVARGGTRWHSTFCAQFLAFVPPVPPVPPFICRHIYM